MKKILYSLVVAALMITTISCEDKFLNLDPLDSPTEAIYFKTPDHFKAATNDFYNKMVGFKRIDDATIFDFVDTGSDLAGSLSDYGRGAIGVPSTDIYWRNSYRYIRSNNYVIQKGEEYTGNKAEIQQYVAAAHFFRAWHHFFLVKRFGGVPVVTKVPDLTDPILTAPRNTRYEVIEQVLKDLDVAIEGLPLESNIVAADKGHLSKQAAKSFKARVLLYEGTWEKYVGETTDFAQGQKKADKVTAYLTEAASLAKDVMSDGTFKLFNELDSLSYYYLFVLEDNKSNPKGLTKANNNEFIFKNMYDKNLNRAALNISHSWGGAGPNRKMMDMYLCKDGLPYTHSPMAKGYHKMTDEFQNRDARLANFVRKPGQKYWGWGVGTNGGGADYTKANYTNLSNWPANIATYYPNLAQVSTSFGYGNRKWVTENPGTETEYESYDYPQIRLAELYLIYAEAMCELGGGKISDADLNISINRIRARAYVAPLTNALIAPYPGLTMLGEIRRERALEMYMENTRFDDLKRWGIAEAELNKPILGIVVKNPDGSPTEVATFKNGTTALYNPAVYPYGVDAATGALIIDQGSNRKFTKKNYLWPLPTDQRLLNPNLVQNPGY